MQVELKKEVQMSLHSLTDERGDLQKQLGCMNGVFQLFHRHHSLAGRRIRSGHTHKRQPPPGQTANHGMKLNCATERTRLQGKNLEEVEKEKQRVPAESSRTSFSSTCSSIFSSVDCNKTAQPEPSSFCQNIFPETASSILPANPPNSSLHLGRQSLDLRDVVKDSMHREARVLTVRTVAKEEGMGHAMKHIDSPRPLQQSKCAQPRVDGYDGSFQVFGKLQEAPWNFKEERDGRLPLAPKDAPRFSYDGRESRDTLKSTVKLKELPRLSLDSRECSIRRSASELRANYLLRDIQRGNGSSSQILNPNQEPGSNKRPSGVVARLMGLEAFPDSISINEGQMMKIKFCQDEDFDTISRSSGKGDESKRNQVSRSPRVSHKEPASTRSRNDNSVMKPSSRFPLEPAPWRQEDGSQASQKLAFKYREAPTKTPHASPSIYGEIEKRLTELEFKKSGKDLRALKQILEAMQKTRERFENTKEDQPSNFESQTSTYNPTYRSFDKGSKLATQQSNHPVSSTVKGTSPPKRYGSPIVIIKPAKLVGKPRISDSSAIQTNTLSGLRKFQTENSGNNRKDLVDRQTVKDPTPRNHHLRDPSSCLLPSVNKKTNARTLQSSLSSKAPQHMNGENSTRFRRSSGSVSPRLQQKKHGMEKQSRPTTPSSDLRGTRRQYNKQPIESESPTRKLKPKSTISQQGNDQSSGFSSDTRNLNHQGNTVSAQSDSLSSQIDTEATSTHRTNEINGTYQPEDPKEKNFAPRLSEDRSMAAMATATLEKPSPVSVLDAAFYEEESPSPMKKLSTVFKDDDTLDCDEEKSNPADIDWLLNNTRPNLGSEFNHDKLENIKHKVHNFRLLNSTQDEATIDHIASLCQNTTPDHRYITETLLASGFLKDLGSCTTTIQVHQAGHLINPNVFHVLENTNRTTELANDGLNEKIGRSKSNEKIQKGVVFDAVNEILVHKLALAASSEQWIFPNKLVGRSLRGEKLLKELQSEMDHLQANTGCSLDGGDDGLTSILSADMMHQSEDWADYNGEVPGIVLDIERRIFKDLISEVVGDGAAGQLNRPGRHCKQLFSK